MLISKTNAKYNLKIKKVKANSPTCPPVQVNLSAGLDIIFQDLRRRRRKRGEVDPHVDL